MSVEQCTLEDVFTITLEQTSLRKKLIFIGETGGEVKLSKDESRMLAKILRDWRDPEDIWEEVGADAFNENI